jgi:hypothetical protein
MSRRTPLLLLRYWLELLSFTRPVRSGFLETASTIVALAMNTMKARYRLVYRGSRGGMFYCVDKTTGKRSSLQTNDKDEARQIVEAKNQAERQPVLNLQIAKAYLAGSDNGVATRTWQNAVDAIIESKTGSNQHRWRTAAKDKALVPLLSRVIVETPLKVMQCRKVAPSTHFCEWGSKADSRHKSGWMSPRSRRVYRGWRVMKGATLVTQVTPTEDI